MLIFSGATGILGLVLRFITPLTIAPSVAMIGLRSIQMNFHIFPLFSWINLPVHLDALCSLFDTAAMNAAQHWGVSMA